MTEETKEGLTYKISTDNPDNPKFMTLIIPLETISKDESINGIIYLTGFFEYAKDRY